MTDVVIVGAGISGLSCAWALKKAGIDCVVLEASDRVGGVIGTESINGFLVEWGPNTIAPTPAVVALFRELELTPAVVRAPRGAPRFVVVNRKLRRAPLEAMTLGGLAKAFCEPFRRRGADDDESVAAFCRRRLGVQAYERLVNPLVTGIYAGDPERMSMAATFPRLWQWEKKHGSLVIGAFREKGAGSRGIVSFAGGMQTLPERLRREADVRVNTPATAETLGARVVVVTAPAYAASPLLATAAADAARLLDQIEYVPMVTAAVELPIRALPSPLSGFGFLVPQRENLNILGALFNSAIFEGRAPGGHALFTVFLGGARNPEVVEWDDDRIWQMVTTEMRDLLSASQYPVPLALKRHFRAIPQFHIGHLNWRTAFRESLKARPGLFVTANYTDGVSVPACIESATATAAQVIEYVKKAA